MKFKVGDPVIVYREPTTPPDYSEEEFVGLRGIVVVANENDLKCPYRVKFNDDDDFLIYFKEEYLIIDKIERRKQIIAKLNLDNEI